jgi:hypothetical protein
MDTTKPPLECPACNKPIPLGESPWVRYATDNETGKLVTRLRAYHIDCAQREGFVS